MSEDTDLKELEQTTFRVSMQDGLTELFLGILLIIVSFTIMSPMSTAWIALFVLFSIPLIEKIKKKYTYPRLGYVKLQVDEPKQLLKGILGFTFVIFLILVLILFILFGDLTNYDQWYRWIPTFFGMVMFGPSLWLVDKTGMFRYYALGILFLFTGVIMSIIEFSSSHEGTILYFFGWGITMIIFGFARFAHFIRNNPLIDIEEGEVNGQ